MNLTVNGKENKAPPDLTLTPDGFNRRVCTPIHTFFCGGGEWLNLLTFRVPRRRGRDFHGGQAHRPPDRDRRGARLGPGPRFHHRRTAIRSHEVMS